MNTISGLKPVFQAKMQPRFGAQYRMGAITGEKYDDGFKFKYVADVPTEHGVYSLYEATTSFPKMNNTLQIMVSSPAEQKQFARFFNYDPTEDKHSGKLFAFLGAPYWVRYINGVFKIAPLLVDKERVCTTEQDLNDLSQLVDQTEGMPQQTTAKIKELIQESLQRLAQPKPPEASKHA